MVKVSKKVNTKEIFRGLQSQMEAKLTFNRNIISHPTSKGTASELEWTEMLSTYLPKRYCADSAFVMDANGNISEQIDIVIFDRQYSPFILRQNGVTYIPAESVYAVIEVKQELNKANIEYAQKKAASVRKLSRTSAPIPHAGGVFDPKKPARILAGILTVDGTLSLEVQEKLANAGDGRVLNFGCSLAGKTYFSLPKLHPWDQNSRPYEIVNKTDDNSLVNFFMNLVAELQKVGTVPAIEIEAYLKGEGELI
jgi:hypothetical protein